MLKVVDAGHIIANHEVNSSENVSCDEPILSNNPHSSSAPVLKCKLFNCRSLKNKFTELQCLLATEPVDIACCTET